MKPVFLSILKGEMEKRSTHLSFERNSNYSSHFSFEGIIGVVQNGTIF